MAIGAKAGGAGSRGGGQSRRRKLARRAGRHKLGGLTPYFLYFISFIILG